MSKLGEVIGIILTLALTWVLFLGIYALTQWVFGAF